jgi:hypothetical protein
MAEVSERQDGISSEKQAAERGIAKGEHEPTSTRPERSSATVADLGENWMCQDCDKGYVDRGSTLRIGDYIPIRNPHTGRRDIHMIVDIREHNIHTYTKLVVDGDQLHIIPRYGKRIYPYIEDVHEVR